MRDLAFRRSVLFGAAALIAGFATPASARPTDNESSLAARLLAAHNHERARVGAPALAWDPALAAAAESYGPTLIGAGTLIHSPRASRPGQRENLWMGTSGYYSPEAMVGSWIAERALTVPGVFPAVSRSGRWEDVSHYTQLVWRSTTHVECAVARGRGQDYLVCRYSPPGNRDGVSLF
jgi:uncharacterized protein YkwD